MQTPRTRCAGFKRFPQWMWRNADVLDFVGWLRGLNEAQKIVEVSKAGFYGLDLYGLIASIEAVLTYLAEGGSDVGRTCSQTLRVLRPIRHRHPNLRFRHRAGDGAHLRGCGRQRTGRTAAAGRSGVLQRDGRVAADEFFYAEQNALVVSRAEQYYRTMFRGEVSSWNLRDHHMMETLRSL